MEKKINRTYVSFILLFLLHLLNDYNKHSQAVTPINNYTVCNPDYLRRMPSDWFDDNTNQDGRVWIYSNYEIKSMNFILNIYYMYMRKYHERGLNAARTLLIIPLTMNFVSMFFFLSYQFRSYIFNFSIDFLLLGLILMAIFGFAAMKYLDSNYTENKRFIDLKLSGIFYLFMPIHYLGSILLVIFSLRYL